MANQSLGYVIVLTPGTPVRLTSTQSDPTARLGVHSYLLEAKFANTGKIYIGSSTMNTTTGAGVFAILPPPTANLYPSFSANLVNAAAAFDLRDLYIDSTVANDGVLVSCIIA